LEKGLDLGPFGRHHLGRDQKLVDLDPGSQRACHCWRRTGVWSQSWVVIGVGASGHRGHARFPFGVAAPRRMRDAIRVWSSNIATVIGPTPPGTGVIQEAR